MLPTGTDIIRAQDNRVPEPTAADFVVMTPIRRERLSTNIDTFVGPTAPAPAQGVAQVMQPTLLDVQLDVHGPNSADNTQIIAALWRDYYATEILDSGPYYVQALYASEARQIPFVNAEQQWENRWVLELYMQVNPVVTAPQDFADDVTVTTINVTRTYPIS